MLLPSLAPSGLATLELTADGVISPYVPVFLVAFLVAFMLTPVMRLLAIRNGIVDRPDARKVHAQPIAYLGGVAIFLGWLAGVSMCMILPPLQLGLAINDPTLHVSFPVMILLGAGAIVITGIVDDVYGVSPRVKVGGQLFAAAALAHEQLGVNLVQKVMILAGVADPSYWPCYALGAAVIAIFVVGGCNAMNLLDGLDGLAAGVSGIANLGLLFLATFAAIKVGDHAMDHGVIATLTHDRIIITLATLGAILGFLPFNFNPASIFMGDTGSLLLGYLSVTTILLFSDPEIDGPFYVMAGLIVFALPIMDTSLAIFRRKMRGQPLFSPDNQHLHHQLLRFMKSLGLSRNMSVKAAVLTLYSMAILFAATGGAMLFLRWRYVLVFFLVIFGFIIAVAYKTGQQPAIAYSPPYPPPSADDTPNSPADLKPPGMSPNPADGQSPDLK